MCRAMVTLWLVIFAGLALTFSTVAHGEQPEQRSYSSMALIRDKAGVHAEYSPKKPSSALPEKPTYETLPVPLIKEKPSSSPLPSSSSPSSSYEPKTALNSTVIKEILDEHNKFRDVEHVGHLKWNETVAQYAQKYADKRKEDCKLVHSKGGPYGENLMWGTGSDWKWATAVDGWAREKKNFDYSHNSCAQGTMCGHYTAVVWNTTTDVGCGRVTCKNGDTFIICSYYPPGNWVGEKPY